MSPTLDELRRRWIDRLSGPARHPIASWLVVGAVFRVVMYVNNRSFWLDEFSLAGNLDHRSGTALLAPFTANQLAPPGWFAAEWEIAWLLGKSGYALRLLSLVVSLAGLAAFGALARRLLAPATAWVAVAMFAVSGDLIVHASEFKPYATDVSLAVLVVLACVRIRQRGSESWRVPGAAALGGAVAVWFSFPVALVLAVVGTSQILTAWRRGDRKAAGMWGLVSLVWGASFVGEHRVATTLLGPEGRHGMLAFWSFAFPPWPITSLRDLVWPVRALGYFFLNPLDFHRPERFDPRLTMVPGVVLFVAGLVSLGRRDRATFALLVAPIVLTLGLAYPRLYPFHSRLVLFLLPAFCLIVAEGVAALDTWLGGGALVRGLILVPVLLFPTAHALHQVIDPNMEPLHNRLGDIRLNSLTPWRYPF